MTDALKTIEACLAESARANRSAAYTQIAKVLRDSRTFQRLRSAMAQEAQRLPATEGVRAIHFVHGFKQTEEFPFFALLAVLSAHAHHPAARIFFFVCHEPTGPYWRIARAFVHLVKVADFDFFGIAPVVHYAHKADVVRLLALHEIGGLYLDCDTVTLRSMNELSSHEFVMGVQQSIPGAAGGFCNAIMMGRAGSAFARRWLRTYRSFQSRGRDLYWDFHSVKLPMYLYSRNTDELFVLPHDKWFFPLWNHMAGFLFREGGAQEGRRLLKGQFAIHLWHNMLGRMLDDWSPKKMVETDCLYASLSKEILESLPGEKRQYCAELLGLWEVGDEPEEASASAMLPEMTD